MIHKIFFTDGGFLRHKGMITVKDNIFHCYKEDSAISLVIPKEQVRYIEILQGSISTYEDANGWIPCSERFPDTDKYILLSFENFSVPLVGRWEEDVTGGAFFIGDETETCIQQDLIVNAWQPLPAQYRSEGE